MSQKIQRNLNNYLQKVQEGEEKSFLRSIVNNPEQ